MTADQLALDDVTVEDVRTWSVSAPTLLPDVPEHVYHAGGVRTPGPQTSQSALKLLRPPSTPREFQHRLVTPAKPRRAFDVGHAAHTLVLGVGAEFVRHPDGYLTSNGAMGVKTESKQWIAVRRQEGKIPLKGDDYDAVYRMAEAILAHSQAAELFTDPGRRPEVSAFHEAIPGLWLRSRFDLLGGGLCDFKTTVDPHPARWLAQAWDLGYHVQDVSYRRSWREIHGTSADPMKFVVVGKEPPHLVGVYTLDVEFERLGADQLDAALAVYLAQHAKHGDPRADGVRWDGLPEETAVLSPPRKAYYDDAEGVDYTPEF